MLDEKPLSLGYRNTGRQLVEGYETVKRRLYPGLYKSHDRVGHVFQDPFKAVLVQKDTHFLEVCRYVVLNPIRGQDGPASTAAEMK